MPCIYICTGSATAPAKSVTVQFVEDGRTLVVLENQKWKLRAMDGDGSDHDQPADFDSLVEGNQVLAYWGPNNDFYAAEVIRSSFPCGDTGQKRVKRQLSLNREELEELSKCGKTPKVPNRAVKSTAAYGRNRRLLSSTDDTEEKNSSLDSVEDAHAGQITLSEEDKTYTLGISYKSVDLSCQKSCNDFKNTFTTEHVV
jgi:hypothetical protein